MLAARATRRSRSLSPALLPLRRRRRTGAGAVGQGGCGRRAFPAGSGTRRCDRGRAAGGGGGRRCSGRGGDRLRGSSEGRRAQSRPPVSVVRAGRAGTGRRGRVQVVVTTGAAGRRAARGARVVRFTSAWKSTNKPRLQTRTACSCVLPRVRSTRSMQRGTAETQLKEAPPLSRKS